MSATGESVPKSGGHAFRVTVGTAVLVLVVAVVSAPSLLAWQRDNSDRIASISHLHRLAYGLQLYSQDYDGDLPEPVTTRGCIDWTERVRGYCEQQWVLHNPATQHAAKLVDPASGCRVRADYALNSRFQSTFARGPFPLYNLELPAQTALLVEAGCMTVTTGRGTKPLQYKGDQASFEYTDTQSRVRGLIPYPSTHDHRIALVAADGHAVSVRVAHYSAKDGPHDQMYGRIGGAIYNWNGGRPNGHPSDPPRE